MRVLNVGCGEDTYGTDFIDIEPHRKEIVICDLNKRFPYKKNTFDELYCRAVFEHIRDPHSFLKECFRVTKKGGRIRIITDNALYIHFSLVGSPHLGGYWGAHKEDQHYSVYTLSHLKLHLESVGFVPFNDEYVYLCEWRELLKPKNFRVVLGGLFSLLLRVSPWWRSSYNYITIEGKK